MPKPGELKIRLPNALVGGGTLVVEAALDPAADTGGSVQVQLLSEDAAASHGLLPGQPILTRPDSPARSHVVQAYDEFRDLFPAAMCHARIVPVDAVVTLVLYHREDDHLSRLMLDEADAARLDRLWHELRYVSRDALRMEVALEQILEFATQDADPAFFDPVREPIAKNADELRVLLRQSEAAHWESLLRFADRAYRRPLHEIERQRLRELYDSLRRARSSA